MFVPRLESTMLLKTLCLLHILDIVVSLNLCGENHTDNVNNYAFSFSNYTVQNCGCSDIEPCITKCCKPGYYLEHRTCKKRNTSKPFTITVYDSEANVPVKEFEFPSNFKVDLLQCKFFVLKPYENVSDQFRITTEGTLWYPSLDKYYENDQYCIEHTANNDELKACICFDDDPKVILIGTVFDAGDFSSQVGC